MSSYRAALRRAGNLKEATGTKHIIYGVRAAQCTCAGDGHDFRGFEYFVRKPHGPIQMPNLTHETLTNSL